MWKNKNEYKKRKTGYKILIPSQITKTKFRLNLNEARMWDLQVVCQVVLLQRVCLKTMWSRVKVVVPNATDEAFSLKHSRILKGFYYYMFETVFILLLCVAFWFTKLAYCKHLPSDAPFLLW